LKRVLLAGQWADLHREEAIRYVAKETRSSESAVVRAYGKDVHRHLHTDLAESSVAALGDFTHFLAAWKFIPQDFDVSSWIDPRPLQQALAELEQERQLPLYGAQPLPIVHPLV
jgi:2'-hydroxybiphenyl-2-sulfinate desulfinase